MEIGVKSLFLLSISVYWTGPSTSIIHRLDLEYGSTYWEFGSKTRWSDLTDHDPRHTSTSIFLYLLLHTPLFHTYVFLNWDYDFYTSLSSVVYFSTVFRLTADGHIYPYSPFSLVGSDPISSLRIPSSIINWTPKGRSIPLYDLRRFCYVLVDPPVIVRSRLTSSFNFFPL